jgi:hypothetical protein
MPGELVVEYQLAAQEMRPDLFVAMAAYGEYTPGYICLKKHYTQGGYEDSPGASKEPPVERLEHGEEGLKIRKKTTHGLQKFRIEH